MITASSASGIFQFHDSGVCVGVSGPNHEIAKTTLNTKLLAGVYYVLLYNDDQSEPLCICLATMVLFYLTDL